MTCAHELFSWVRGGWRVIHSVKRRPGAARSQRALPAADRPAASSAWIGGRRRPPDSGLRAHGAWAHAHEKVVAEFVAESAARHRAARGARSGALAGPHGQPRRQRPSRPAAT